MAAEEARIVCVLLEAETDEDLADFVIPVLWATAQAIQRTFEQPKLIFLSVGISDRRFDDRDFIRGKDTLKEGVFAVSLFQCGTFLNSHTDKKAESIPTKDRGIFLGLGPDTIFMVAQNNDARFSAMRTQHFVRFDGEDTHCWNCPRGALCTVCTVLFEGEDVVRIL